MSENLSSFYDWFSERNIKNDYHIDIASLSALDGWKVDSDGSAIRHRTGKFFSIEGLSVETQEMESHSWSQPIINQPEIGILGIVVTKVGDSYHFLMQAKMEPGNINLIQLSPTVQATRSNYTRVHRGSAVPFLEHFVAARPGSVVFDSLQSEQGSWFLGKRNRNMIVEVPDRLPAGEDFIWLSFEQIAALLRVPNLVNMDSRTVLSGLPFLAMDGNSTDSSPVHSLGDLLSWFTDAKSRHRLDRRTVPLHRLPGWEFDGDKILRPDGRHFTVIGVDVAATNREVAHWSQPMLRPIGRGVIAFVGRLFHDEFHILVHARTEAGTADVVEMGPTVACIPASYENLTRAERPPFLDLVEQSDTADVLVDVVHSEEGGRFYHAESRYLVVDVGESIGHQVPENYCWMTVEQLTGFVRYSNHVNVAARCLLSCMADGVAERTAVTR
ncbi:MAG: NDP-hexose 2,3-dehydratase family protein [Rhodococcus sp. (in: high G+C Gram-positive bacteria)]|uniref:NDP-hexose 2,3-dehydratase family protein n=1 Tax=Rhodococcus sp. EPR-157 TaxID=1813677 RepID=UPI0007BB64B7|nr:NDP-hexose 2,3-dehydratase family protein [Rhodococcus sp. EPR-157]KZF00654.1 NDP-hexose 2,3-dehydratase [Rhodococcus sp. EPR-157]